MFQEPFFKQIKTWKKLGYADNRVKELSAERGYSEKDISDTLRYFEIEKQESFPADIGKGKLAAMIALCWTTPFVGLLHIIFLWKSKTFRVQAIIALALSLSRLLIFLPLIIAFTLTAFHEHPMTLNTLSVNNYDYKLGKAKVIPYNLQQSIPDQNLRRIAVEGTQGGGLLSKKFVIWWWPMGLAIWMTVIAVKAYNKSKMLRFKILNPELSEE